MLATFGGCLGEKWKFARRSEICFKTKITNENQEINFRITAKALWIDWGDGQHSYVEQPEQYLKHKYTSLGIYQVTVKGIAIRELEIRKCNLIYLNVSKCNTLEFIDCSENILTSLDIRNCSRLYEFYCEVNRLKELKLRKYKKLFYLSCAYNYLEHIELKGCRKLVSLICKQNRLNTLDVSKCLCLSTVNIEGNNMDSFAIDRFIASLRSRRRYDRGFLTLRGNIGSGNYDRTVFLKKGWYEI